MAQFAWNMRNVLKSENQISDFSDFYFSSYGGFCLVTHLKPPVCHQIKSAITQKQNSEKLETWFFFRFRTFWIFHENWATLGGEVSAYPLLENNQLMYSFFCGSKKCNLLQFCRTQILTSNLMLKIIQQLSPSHVMISLHIK